MAIDDRPTIAAPDDDPYLWLEEVEGERALDFVDRQSRLTLEAFGGRQFETDRDTLAAIYDRSDNIPYVTRRGGLVYNLWKDAKNPRGVWRRTTLADFRNAEPGWETLLDIDRLATEEDKDWLLNWTQPLPGNSRVIVAPFARRQRRGNAAGIRSGHQGFHRRRIHPAGSQERGRMDRRRHAPALERPWRGHGDDFRLRENRPAVAPRRARGTRAGAVRSAGRPDGRVLQRR